jgi:zinc protease
MNSTSKFFSFILFFTGIFFLTFHAENVCAKEGKLTRHRLPNGLEVLIQEDHAKKVATAQLWVMVGSADEESSERGISHLIEHMAFKGTAKRGLGQIASEVEALGGEINAYTSWDETVFHITGPSSAMSQSLDILTDAVLHPSIDQGELQKEKQVVLEEILESAERPERKSSQLLFDTAYVASPYKFPVIGYKDIVEKLSRDDILAFRKKWYVPENMFLLVVGDVNTSEVLKEVEKLTAELKPVGFFRPPRPSEPKQQDIRTAFVADDNSRETRLNIAFHIPGAMSIDVNALDLTADILGGRDSSRMIKILKKDKGLVHSISVSSLTPKDPGLMIVSATLDFKNLEAATRGIFEEIKRISAEPPSAQELERAKTHIESQHVYSMETVQGTARNIGSCMADNDDPNYEDKYLILNNAVTGPEISKAAKTYMDASDATVSVLAPGDPAAKAFNMDSLSQVVKSFGAASRTLSKKQASAPETVSTTLKNGARVIITPDDANPVVSIKVAHLGGKRYETKETEGIMNFMAQTLTKGAGNLSEVEIAKKIENIGGRLSGFSGYDSFGLSTTVLSRHVEEAMKLTALVCKDPTFPQDKVERERQLILNRIKTEPDRPVQYAITCLNKEVFKHHPYGFDREGTLATVAKITKDDLANCYRKYSDPANSVISIVGSIEPDRALALLEKYFGDIPASSFQPPKVPAETPIEQPRQETIRIPRAKSHVALGYHAVSLSDPDRYPLEVLNNLLSGQGGRLFLELRDKESLAYVVTSFFRPTLDPGLFGFYIACDVPKTEKALAGLSNQIEKVRSNPVSPQELQRSVNNLIGNHEIALQSTWARAEDHALNTLYGLGWNYEDKYVKKISEVKTEDVLRVARKYLDPKKQALLKILPENDDK